MRSTGLTPKRELAGRIRLAKPSAREGEVLLEAGFKPSVARAPKRNGLDSRTFAAQVAAATAELVTPREARRIGLDGLLALALDAETNPQVKTVALRELVQYGLNAPDDLDNASATQGAARSWHRAQLLDVLRLAMRFALRHPYLAARMLAAQSPEPPREAPKASEHVIMPPSAKI